MNEHTEKQKIEAVELAESYLKENYQKVTPSTKKSFIEICKAFCLNPYKREIYLTSFYDSNGKLQENIIVGYEVYLKRAESLKVLDGWNVSTEIKESVYIDKENGCIKKKDDLIATCTIYRKDFSKPFSHSVCFSEYAQYTKSRKLNKFWGEKPGTMLKKVAIAQSFRLCFPDTLSGMPYLAEEIGGSEEETLKKEVSTQKTKDVQNDKAVMSELDEELKELAHENLDTLDRFKSMIDTFNDENKLSDWAKKELANISELFSETDVAELRGDYRARYNYLREQKESIYE